MKEKSSYWLIALQLTAGSIKSKIFILKLFQDAFSSSSTPSPADISTSCSFIVRQQPVPQ